MKRLLLPASLAAAALFGLALLLSVGDIAAEVIEPVTSPKPKVGPLGMKFVALPKATFYMGWKGYGRPTKMVISESFEIAVHEVTQGQWQAVMGKNPSYFSRKGGGEDGVKGIKDEDLKQFPVENVSWEDVRDFIKKLNEKEKRKGYRYRLPTRVEWEYACRGGATTEEECSYHFYFAKPTNDLSSKQANFDGDRPFGKAEKGPCLERPTKVGSYPPNKLGLYDMHGNVWEWTSTAVGRDDGSREVAGGGWGDDGNRCRPWYRPSNRPTARLNRLGFRLARVPVPRR